MIVMTRGDAPLRVTFVIMDVGPRGGMERQATEVLRGLVEAGHDVTVVARRCELPDDVPVRFRRVRAPRRPFTAAFPIFVLLATAAVRRCRADVVHVNGAIVLNRADVLTMHFCHRAFQHGHPLSEREVGNVARRVNTRLVSVMTRWLETFDLQPRRCSSVVAISSGVGAEAERWYPRRTSAPTVIPYGVDRRRFAPNRGARADQRQALELEEEDLLGVFVGGEWQRKGLHHAIEAVGRRGRWHLAVAGEGDRRRYEQIATAAGAVDRVHFLGVVDPAPLYAAADAWVFPTAYETFSLATHEAAAAGLPLLVTRVSGPDVLVRPGVNGWFIRCDADDIASRLAELEGDPELLASMRRAAREATRGLSWDVARASHLELYRALADRRLASQ